MDAIGGTPNDQGQCEAKQPQECNDLSHENVTPSTAAAETMHACSYKTVDLISESDSNLVRPELSNALRGISAAISKAFAQANQNRLKRAQSNDPYDIPLPTSMINDRNWKDSLEGLHQESQTNDHADHINPLMNQNHNNEDDTDDADIIALQSAAAENAKMQDFSNIFKMKKDPSFFDSYDQQPTRETSACEEHNHATTQDDTPNQELVTEWQLCPEQSNRTN